MPDCGRAHGALIAPYISLFFIIRTENQIDTAYITATSAVTKAGSSTGELTAALIMGESAGSPGRKNKVTKKPAAGIYINTRPLIEPNL